MGIEFKTLTEATDGITERYESRRNDAGLWQDK